MYNIVVYFLAGPEVCRLVSVSTHTSYLQIDPLSETLAEVALDVDWISAADSSFGFSSPINFARARHWSDKQHGPQRRRLRRHLPTWYRIRSVRRLSISKGLLEHVALRRRCEPTDTLSRPLGCSVFRVVRWDTRELRRLEHSKMPRVLRRRRKLWNVVFFFFSHCLPLYSPPFCSPAQQAFWGSISY